MYKKFFSQKFTQSQQGELLIFFEALLWSLFPIVTILSFSTLTPLVSVAFSTLFAALFFAVVITIKKQWPDLKVTAAWKDIAWTIILVGVIFYGLIFIGLETTSAGNASIIMLMEVFFSFLILILWKKERLIIPNIVGAMFMVAGALLILFPGTLQINKGDLFILIATIVPPVGNYFTQQARQQISANMIMFIRSLISGLFLLGLALFLKHSFNYSDLTHSFWFLMINGLILLGFSKILWIEAIHRIPITKAISLTSIGPAFTLLFAYLFLGDIITKWQIMGFLPICIGVILLTSFKKNLLNQPAEL